jgi:hypothetical protein
MRLLLHLTVVLPITLIAFLAFTIAMKVEWIREAWAVKTPIFVSATQSARRSRRRI